jgi:hypothetical protein
MPPRLDGWLMRLALAAPPGIVESPHPLLLALLVIVSGAALVLAGGRSAPQSLERSLPTPLVLAWGVFLVAGGALSLSGLLLRGVMRRSRAMGLERAGNSLLAPAALIYGLVLFEQGGGRAAVAAGLSIAFGLASAIYSYTRRPVIWQRLLRRQIERELAGEG